MSNPLIAAPKDSTTAVSGVPLLEDAQSVKTAISSGDWASGVLGVAGTAMDALGMVTDPFGAILAAGVGWLLEHVGPLKEALDKLAGNPDVITSYSETWQNVSGELGSIADELSSQVQADLTSWQGPAADAYRKHAGDLGTLLGAAQQATSGAADGVKTAGEVVAAVRQLVRDTIAELVGHLISWALQVIATLGIAMSWVLPQVISAVAKTASKITSLVTNLVKALKQLITLLKKAGGVFGDTAKAFKNFKPGNLDRASNTPVSRARTPGEPASSRDIESDDSSPREPPPLSIKTSPLDDEPTSPSSSGSATPTAESYTKTPTAESGTTSASSSGSATPTAESGTHAPPAADTPEPAPKPDSKPYNAIGYNPETKVFDRPVTFKPEDVTVQDLKDSDGKTTGISYAYEPADKTKISKWAGKPHRTSDSQFMPDYKRADHGGHTDASKLKPTPWANELKPGQSPFYVQAHSDSNYYSIQASVDGKPQEIVVDGSTHGKLVSGNASFQAASGADPNRPVVLMSCNSAHPQGSAASTSATQLHDAGHSGAVYAPTGTGTRKTPRVGDESYYGVQPAVITDPKTGKQAVDANGEPIFAPGEFKRFRRPSE